MLINKDTDTACVNNWKRLHEEGYFPKHNHYKKYHLNSDGFVDWLNDEVGLCDTDDVLEIGCGYGRVMYAIADRVHSIVGVDVHEDPLSKAREVLKDKPNATVLLGDGKSLPVPDESVSVIYAASAMQHMPRSIVKQYVFECSRVLKPYGRCMLQFFNGAYGGSPDINPEDHREQSVSWKIGEMDELAAIFAGDTDIREAGKSIIFKGWA